jgi:hypothetical protein
MEKERLKVDDLWGSLDRFKRLAMLKKSEIIRKD